MFLRALLAAASFGFVSLGGVDGAFTSLVEAVSHIPHAQAMEPESSAHRAEAHTPIWTIDADGDGVAEYSNPTHAGVRGVDAFGSGDFGAVRDAGKRRHHGVDYIAQPGVIVRAPIAGEVTHIGYAYRSSSELRLVEITDPETKASARALYVSPSVAPGAVLAAGDDIGLAQDLGARYPGITNHVHVELRDAHQRLVDVSTVLPSAPLSHAATPPDAEDV